MPSKFTHCDLKLVRPAFESNLTSLIVEMEVLRRKTLRGTTKAHIFFELKSIFHMVESISSARIEGNNTTILEYIETKIDHKSDDGDTESIREIENVERALEFIDGLNGNFQIDRTLISELHKLVVGDLDPNREGDSTPGQYRNCPVGIKNSFHVPPENDILIEQYMNELFEFVNRKDSPQYDLIKTAIAHHRFVWIHPFRNGNGRTVRLFTYAMLVKQGFKVDIGQRIINPTAVFCSSRDKYYRMLAKADSCISEGMIEWCEYVLEGLREEIEKVDRLSDYSYLKEKILEPALEFSLERKLITEEEFKILSIAMLKQVIQAKDIKPIFKDQDAAVISRKIRKLVEKTMLVQVNEGGRRYTLKFSNNYLLRGIINALDKENFLPIKAMHSKS